MTRTLHYRANLVETLNPGDHLGHDPFGRPYVVADRTWDGTRTVVTLRPAESDDLRRWRAES